MKWLKRAVQRKLGNIVGEENDVREGYIRGKFRLIKRTIPCSAPFGLQHAVRHFLDATGQLFCLQNVYRTGQGY